MGSTYLVGAAAAALMLASTAIAQTPAPTPAPAPEATNPAAGPASPPPATTTPPATPPYRGATTTSAPAPTGPRLEAGARVVNAQNVQVGEVVSVNQATDGSVTVDLRTKAGAVKTLPVAAFGSLEGSVAVRLNEAEINAAPNAAPRPAVPAAAATPATPAVPAIPATPASPAAATPAIPATPATPATPAEPEEEATPPDSPN